MALKPMIVPAEKLPAPSRQSARYVIPGTAIRSGTISQLHSTTKHTTGTNAHAVMRQIRKQFTPAARRPAARRRFAKSAAVLMVNSAPQIMSAVRKFRTPSLKVASKTVIPVTRIARVAEKSSPPARSSMRTDIRAARQPAPTRRSVKSVMKNTANRTPIITPDWKR